MMRAKHKQKKGRQTDTSQPDAPLLLVSVVKEGARGWHGDCYLPGVAEDDPRLPRSLWAPAGLGVERPFTIWDLGRVDRDSALLLRLLRAICGPGGHRPV